MICKTILQENNGKRPCWLPMNPDSPFGLCSRCDYFKTEEILLQETFTDISIFSDEAFQKEACQKNHIESLLGAFTRLLQTKDPNVSDLFREYSKNKDFKQILKHQAPTHRPSNRCCLYQHYYKDRSEQFPGATPLDLPIHCWPCMAYISRQREMLGFYSAFLIRTGAHQLHLPSNIQSVVDVMISLELNKKPNLVRTLLNTYRLSVSDKILEKTLVEFFSQPATADLVFLDKARHYIPAPSLHCILETLPKNVLAAIRKRNWIFKEELMMRTWRSDHMIKWCFDIEEQKDYDELERN